MDQPSAGNLELPVDRTLRKMVVGFRGLVCIWVLALVAVDILEGDPGNRLVMGGAVAVAVVWTGVTVWAAGTGRLRRWWFAVTDGVVVLFLSAGGWLAGANDFFSGGYPMSWLFVVAYAGTLRAVLVAAGILLGSHFALHLIMGLGWTRTVGTFQFVVFGLLAGWTFDNLRRSDRALLATQEMLAGEQRAAARQEERVTLARRLHDEVLQTLHVIRVEADDPSEVRYLARRQERELRRTIEEMRSPYEKSFRARLLAHRDEVEDVCQWVKVTEVVRSDAPVTPALEASLSAAREAMMNAAKHSGSERIDLYSEVEGGFAVIHIRDRGQGFDEDDPRSPIHSLNGELLERVEAVGGTLKIDSRLGAGTEVTITVPVS